MKIAVITLGCRTNQAESDCLDRNIVARGHQSLRSIEGADLVIINSCTVTAKADRQSRNIINSARKSGARVFITGCFADLNTGSYGDDQWITVINNANKGHIINMIADISSINALGIKSPRNRPIIKVQDGCNDSCTYCIVPRARGRSRSVPPDKILDEVRQYVLLGYNEVVLSGIHLGHYGLDLLPKRDLTHLLKMLLDNTGIHRIRLSSIEINEVSDTMLDMIDNKCVCSHLHIPLQGGTNRLLSAMNRRYTIEEYRERILHISSRSDKIAIGSDIMVGFPGESEDEFSCALDAIRSIPFSYLHVFPFSRRPGTAAYTFPGQVRVSDKKKRSIRVNELGKAMHSDFIKRNVGAVHEMIVESLGDGHMTGTTSNYIKVKVPYVTAVKPGSLVRIRIAGVTAGEIQGIALNGC